MEHQTFDPAAVAAQDPAVLAVDERRVSPMRISFRKGRFSIPDLYLPTPESQYHYRNGVNPQAVVAFLPSAAIALVLALVPAFGKVAPFGAALGAIAYFIVTRGRPLVADPAQEMVGRAE